MTQETLDAGCVVDRFVIDLDQAVRLTIPRPAEPLTPEEFTVPDGRRGWTVRLPQNKPVATPAYADGRLYLGGGYGSHEFYAFDARDGRVVWQIHTNDDGPTAAVVEDDLVAFNTESCTVVVAEAKTGRVVWQEWLGDPLMSQPAIWAGKLFMAYPNSGRKPGGPPAASNPARHDGAHRLLCADLRTGRHLWEHRITADAITAPVVSDGRVYLSCLDGTSFCFQAESGELVWTQENQATSAPLVIEGRLIMTEKSWRDERPHEGLRRTDSGSGIHLDEECLLVTESPYLHQDRGGGSGLSGAYSQDLDTAVGFGTAPTAAKLDASAVHLGVSTVSGAWAYQGSRPTYAKGRIYNCQGPYIHCVEDNAASHTRWKAEVIGRGVNRDDQVFLPPSLGRQRLYLCSTRGHIVSLDQDDGHVGLMYASDRAMSFQPCLAGGAIYAGTSKGELLCLVTGDEDADGWPMWGGNAQHNRVEVPTTAG
jgi:Ca-activated chloride channel family protein